MKRILFFVLALITSAALFAQTTITDNNARSRQVGPFTGVKVSSGIELLLQQGDKDAVAVSSSKPEYQERIKTEVDGGVLKIYIDNEGISGNWRKNVKFKAYVSVRTLEKLAASSGATIKTGNLITVNNLDLDASSGAIIEAEFKAQNIVSDNSSGSIAKIKGTTGSLTVEASSGSVFKAYDLSCTNASADVSSGGQVDITVTKELNAEASSGGAINYKGGAVIRNLKTSSGGSVRSDS